MVILYTKREKLVQAGHCKKVAKMEDATECMALNFKACGLLSSSAVEGRIFSHYEAGLFCFLFF